MSDLRMADERMSNVLMSEELLRAGRPDDDELPARSRLLRRLSLLVGGLLTALLLAGAAVLRVASPGGEADSVAGRLVAVLVGTGLLLVALLAIPRAPRLAWALLTVAAGIGLVEALAVVRSYEAGATGTAWRDLTLLGGVALVAAVGVAAGYADVNRWDATRGARLAVLLVILGAFGTALAAAWAFIVAARGEPVSVAAGELTPLRFATRLALITLAGAFALGLARDLWPAGARAAARLAGDAGAPGDRFWRFLGYLADELVPGRLESRRRLAEAERSRLAADLHALVLPDLRRAAAAAAQAGAPDDVQLDLRRALEDVEQLMNERQSVVLEQFGLIAALEWLAERTEERSRLRVELDLGATVPDGPRTIHPAVARAVFRIALLGLDNVVRHANARTARVYLTLDRMGLRLLISDDGSAAAGGSATAFGPATGRVAAAGRGIADMRAQARASGGEVQVEGGTSVRIDARWPPERLGYPVAP